MLTVWKFPLALDDIVDVPMPSGATLLHVDAQDPRPNLLQLWALVDDERPVVTRRLRIAGTGHDLSEAAGWPPLDVTAVAFGHVGTVLVAERMLVWHVFDLGEATA